MILFLSKQHIVNTAQIAHATILVDDPKAEQPTLTGLRLKMADGATIKLDANDGGQVVQTLQFENQMAQFSSELLQAQVAASAMRNGSGLIKP